MLHDIQEDIVYGRPVFFASDGILLSFFVRGRLQFTVKSIAIYIHLGLHLLCIVCIALPAVRSRRQHEALSLDYVYEATI